MDTRRRPSLTLDIKKPKLFSHPSLLFSRPIQEAVEINEKSAIFFASELSGEFPESSAAEKKVWCPVKNLHELREATNALAPAPLFCGNAVRGYIIQ